MMRVFRQVIQNCNNSAFKKKVTLAFLIFFTLTLFFQNSQAFALFFSSFPQKYDIVAILVEKNLYQNTNNYPGLKDQFPALLPDTTIKKRIDRYASDIQKKSANTRALIIQVDPQEKTESIANTLEKLYFDGDPSEPDRKSKLVGAVLVGEVPLPIVNKNSNRFLSMFPYTDFEKKTYIFNPQTNDFELNKDREGNPAIEIWHGVIRSPDPSNPDLLAQYFDKNYLYNLKHPQFANFGKNIFFADLFFEKKGINPFGFRNYKNFTKHIEDIAYLRYTKELFKQLYDEMNAKFEEEGLDTQSLPPDLAQQTEQEKQQALREASRAACAEARQKVQRECRRGFEETRECVSSREAQDAICNNPPRDILPVDSSGIPDIQTKPLISKYLSEYKDIFNKFLGEINDFVGYTGRYDPKTDLDSAISLITIKDKFTWAYLREINDMLERETDRMIAEIEKPIPIIADTEVYLESVKFKLPRGGESASFTASRSPFGFPKTTFSNHSIGQYKEVSASEVFGPQMIDAGLATYRGGILGTKAGEIENVSQCSNYRGTPYNLASGKISKLVEENRVFDIATGTRRIQIELINLITGTPYTEEVTIQGLTTQEQEALPRDRDPDLENAGSRIYGGCFYDNFDMNNPRTASLRCFPDLASKSILDPAGAKKLDRYPQTRAVDDYRTCYFFHEKEQYEDYFDASAIYLEKLTNEDRPVERDRIRREIPSPYKHPREIVVFESNASDRRVHDALRGLGFNRPPSFQLTLDAVLSEINLNPNSPSELSNVFLSRNGRQVIRLASHPFIAEITLKVRPNIIEADGRDKYISSIFTHKEPTNQTIKAQVLAQATADMPVDNPRYATFQDRDRNPRKIIYPNVFQAKNIEELASMLEAKEQEIISIENGARPERFKDRLKNLISIGPEQTGFLPFRNQPIIVRANEEKAKDAVLWKEMNLEQKHRYAFLTYLDVDKNPFVAKKQDGYEFLYLNSTGSADFFDVDFQLEPPLVSEEFADLQKNQEEKENQLREKREEASLAGGGAAARREDLSGMGPYLVFDLSDFSSPWLRAMEQWIGDMAESLQSLAPGESGESFYETLHEKQKKDKEALNEELEREREMEEPESRVKIISLSSDFPVLSKGGNSKTEVKFFLKDKSGAIIKDEAFKITALLNNDFVKFSSAMEDEDNNIPGMQISVINGEGEVSLVSTENTGVAVLQIKLDDSSLSAEIPILAVDEAKIILETNNLGVVANGAALIPVNIKITDKNSIVLEMVNADVSLKVQDESLGKFRENKVRLNRGKGSTVFLAGKKTGEAVLQAGSGAITGFLKIQLLPGAPKFLKLFKEASSVVAKIFDENGNAVTTDSATEVKFEIFQETRQYGRLSNENFVRVNKGAAQVNLLEGDLPGEVRIKVSDKRNQLTPGVISIKSAMRITARDIQENPPNVLFAALLGAPSGDISKPSSFSNWFLFSGKTQAVASLSAGGKTGRTLASISPEGEIKIQNPRISIVVREDDSSVIEFQDSKFHEKIAKLEGDTLELEGDTLAGIVVEENFTGNSTAQEMGYALRDTEEMIDKEQMPGFQYNSFEDSLSVKGIGFTEGNKAGLLFAGGSSVGEANMPYISDATIILGDPTVKIDNSKEEGFSSDAGKFLFSAQGDVEELLDIDYNTDGLDDLLIVYGDGNVHLFENDNGRGFKDKGILLKIANKIASIAKGDVNGDSKMDIIIAAQEKCRKIDTCIDIYENRGNSFTRKNLKIDISDKVQLIKTADLNRDDKLDLIVVDDSGDIRVYYNRGASFELRGDIIGNMGLKIDPSKNLIPSVLVIYQNGTQKYADAEDSPLKFSTKFARDENSGTVKNNDSVSYTITLKNDSNNNLRFLRISDVVPEQLEVKEEEIACGGCEIEKQDKPGRPFIFKNISIPARGTAAISYSGIYKTSVEKTPKLVVAIGNNFSNDYNVRDNFLDLAVSSEDNPSGKVRYFYSTGLDRKGHVVYRTVLSSISAEEQVEAENLSPEKAAQKARQEALDAINNREAKKREAQNLHNQNRQGDSDSDGIPDTMDNINGTLDTIAEVSQGVMSKLKCDAGCLALPINIAFLAPGFFSVLGVPAGFDPGLPVFAWGVTACVATTAPACIPIWPPNPYQTSVGGRIYLAPTLTGSVGTGICLGPYLGGQCFAFAVDIMSLISGDTCDKLNQGIQSAVSKANSAISDLNQGLVLNLGNQKGGTGSANPRESGGLVNYNLGSYEAPVARSRNTRIPGFPGVITDWFAAQVDEIVDKLIDIPDIYLIYPSLKSLGGAFLPEAAGMKIRSIADFLTYLNSIPLLDIEIEEILFKVPIVTRKDFERILYDYDQWKTDLQLEWEKIKQIWKCGTLQSVKDVCKFVDIRVNDMIRTVNENLENLEDWLLFPKRIADYRQIEGYVLRQLVEYLDTIVQYTGGYLKKQAARIMIWEKQIRNMKQALKTWQALLDIMLDYQESCDKCKSERFTLVELLLKTFVAIPTPPVIPFPKLPDIVVDISKIQAGARVIWPQLQLKPVPLILPRLPRIRIPLDPLSLPQLQVILPQLPVIIPPAPKLPEIPGLPDLNLPKLPDFIPPAPKLPQIPSEIHAAISILKKILKIWCIVKSGLIPIPEIYLKSEIEAMTARPLSPLLPIDFLATITQPTITVSYVDQIAITAFLNLNIETRALVDIVKGAALEANKFSQDFADVFNKKMREIQKTSEGILQPDWGAPELWQHEGGIKIDLNKTNYLDDLKRFAELVPRLNEIKKENEELIASLPKEIKLEVNSQEFIPKGRSIDEIKAKRIFENHDNEFVKKLANFRDSLIAYSEDIADKDMLYASASLDFGEGGLKKRLFADSDFVLKEQKKEGKIKIGELDLAKDSGQTRYISLANPRQPQHDDAGTGNINDVGLFIANPQTGESERILSYTRENDSARKLLFIDYDKDQDKDLIYTSGTDVFLKTYGEPVREERFFHFSEDNIAYFDLEDIFIAAPALNNVKVVSQGVKDAVISFNKSPIQNLAGYTLNAKNRLFDFFVEPRLPSSENKNIQIKQSRGEIQGEIKDGAVITVPDNGLLELTLPDLTYLRANGPSKFSMPEKGKGKMFVTEGDITLILPQKRDYLLPGTLLQSFGGRLFIQSDGFSYSIDKNEESILPAIEKANTFVENTDGSIYIYGRKREIIESGGDEIQLNTSEIIHPLEESELKIALGSGKNMVFTLTPQQNVLVSDIFGANAKLKVKDGRIEILTNEKIKSRAQEGMMIEEGDIITTGRGNLTLRYFNGIQRQVSSNKEFSFEFLKDPDNPQITLKLNPGDYYGKVTAFDARGILGTSGETILLAPSICADKTPPFADTGSRKYRVPLLKTLELDASKSFDTESDVIKFTLDNQGSDISPEIDRDEDSILTNDADNPKFILGPFKETGARKMKLSVFDEAFNEGAAEIEIEVVTPEIFIDKAQLKAGIISGWLEPPDKNVPITIGRFRDNVWDILRKTATNAAGKFLINDLDLRDRLVVKNHEGAVVAEINRKNGGITVTDNRYHLEAMPAKAAKLPTRIAIVDQNGVILTFVYFVPDVNSDTIIDNFEMEYTKENVASLSGVHIKPLVESVGAESRFSFVTLPNDDPNLPGATIISLNRQKIAVIDVNGDIIFFDAKLRLKVKDRNFDDPVVFELFYEDKKIAQIYISVNLAKDKFIKIIDAAEVAAIARPKPIAQKGLPFADISSKDPLAKTLQDLHEKGIIQGYQDERGNVFFDKNKQISRAEFAKIVLEMLCIKPRDAAKKVPEVFIDIKAREPKQWFYEYTKEAYLQGFIFGYEGERDSRTGLTPFKPQNPITRAEAVKIILEALESLHEIDLSKINKNAEPWYLPYIAVSQDLTPYLKKQSGLARTYILTKEEAKNPAKKLTRGEFAQIAQRVLAVRDCFSFDLDNDKLPDFWEKKTFGGTDLDGDDDPDNDMLTNKEEMDLKTDPLDPDTDQGGIKDGEEVKNRRTNPLDPSDDREMIPRELLRLEEGIFVIRPACRSCPCLATITQGAELFKGDIIFAAIVEEERSAVLAKSEEIIY